MIYRAKLTGTFEVTQDCRADSEEEARKIFEENRGEDVESTATSLLEVISIEELD